MKKLILITLMLLSFTTMFAQEKPTVVIVPFDAVGVDEKELNVLFEVFTSEFAGLGIARVVDRNSFDKIRAQHSFQNSDWSDSDKIAQLGKALNANMVVTGQILLFKGNLVATFRMLDVNTVEIVATTTERINNTDELFDKIGDVARNLTNNMNNISSEKKEITTKNNSTKENNTPSKQIYSIGDEGPGGGIVFYYSEEGFLLPNELGGKRYYYLEVSKNPVAESIRWCPCRGTSFCGTSYPKSLGSGKVLTYKIISEPKHKNKLSTTNCAAFACYNFSTPQTSKGEWWLPSMQELFLIFNNLYNVIDIGNGVCWSCTEPVSSEPDISALIFRDGYPDSTLKYLDGKCYAIRAF